MTFKLLITESAQGDLAAIFSYIALENPKAAQKLVNDLRTKISSLKTLPKRCPLAQEDGLLDVNEVRHLIFDNYRVIFCIEGKTVTILAIRHGARLPLSKK